LGSPGSSLSLGICGLVFLECLISLEPITNLLGTTNTSSRTISSSPLLGDFDVGLRGANGDLASIFEDE
jgi:hypothetical protein